MTLIKHQLQEQGYVTHSLAEQTFQKDLREQLIANKKNYSHFATVTFAQSVALAHVPAALNSITRSLSGTNQAKVTFVYFCSLSPEAQFRYATSNDHGDISSDIIAQWHVHMLLGNIRSHVTIHQIRKAISQKAGNICDVKYYDGSDNLMYYITDTRRGNLIGSLVQTNDDKLTCVR